MQLHFSPGMTSITISSSHNRRTSNGGSGDLMKIKVAPFQISHRNSVRILAFLLPFLFILTTLVMLEAVNKYSSIGCLGRRMGPMIVHKSDDSGNLVKDFIKVLNQVKSDKFPDEMKVPDSFSQFVSEMKKNKYSSKEFALILKGMMERSGREIRESKFAKLVNKHFAASSFPKSIHCLSIRLMDECSSNANARMQLPSPQLLSLLSDNSYYHFVLSTDNILAASVIVNSVQSSENPGKIIFHVITDKKTYPVIHSWFALNPVYPAIVQTKGVHQFVWLTRQNVPVLEVVENHNGIRNYYHGNHIAGTSLGDVTTTLKEFASKLQARNPKCISLLNHLRVYLPEIINQCVHFFYVIAKFSYASDLF